MSVALTPLPKVTPTASKADSAISITSPAAKLIMMLPLNSEPTPTESNLETVASGIAEPF